MLFFTPMKKAALLLASLACVVPPAPCATLTVLVQDAAGSPLEDSVAWATPRSPLAPAPPLRAGAVEQINKTFVPLVTVVQAGAQVAFPNRDEVRHHVYSFSPAKVFEIKLYAGAATPPRIVFDKAGEVVLGCNIHDTMLGYILVVDSPFYGKSAREGRVKLEGLPEGEYDVHAWHPLQAAAPEVRIVRLRAEEAAETAFTVAVKPRLRPLPR
jgi:plastocyanin